MQGHSTGSELPGDHQMWGWPRHPARLCSPHCCGSLISQQPHSCKGVYGFAVSLLSRTKISLLRSPGNAAAAASQAAPSQFIASEKKKKKKSLALFFSLLCNLLNEPSCASLPALLVRITIDFPHGMIHLPSTSSPFTEQLLPPQLHRRLPPHKP